jgi:hypothetical protein
MSHLSTIDGKSICELQGLRVSRAFGVDGASFTAFLSHDAAVAVGIRGSALSILDADDGTRYRATVQGVTTDARSAGHGLASVRGKVRQLL